jgi:hypothetical protein
MCDSSRSNTVQGKEMRIMIRLAEIIFVGTKLEVVSAASTGGHPTHTNRLWSPKRQAQCSPHNSCSLPPVDTRDHVIASKSGLLDPGWVTLNADAHVRACPTRRYSVTDVPYYTVGTIKCRQGSETNKSNGWF